MALTSSPQWDPLHNIPFNWAPEEGGISPTVGRTRDLVNSFSSDDSIQPRVLTRLRDEESIGFGRKIQVAWGDSGIAGVISLLAAYIFDFGCWHWEGPSYDRVANDGRIDMELCFNAIRQNCSIDRRMNNITTAVQDRALVEQGVRNRGQKQVQSLIEKRLPSFDYLGEEWRGIKSDGTKEKLLKFYQKVQKEYEFIVSLKSKAPLSSFDFEEKRSQQEVFLVELRSEISKELLPSLNDDLNEIGDQLEDNGKTLDRLIRANKEDFEADSQRLAHLKNQLTILDDDLEKSREEKRNFHRDLSSLKEKKLEALARCIGPSFTEIEKDYSQTKRSVERAEELEKKAKDWRIGRFKRVYFENLDKLAPEEVEELEKIRGEAKNFPQIKAQFEYYLSDKYKQLTMNIASLEEDRRQIEKKKIFGRLGDDDWRRLAAINKNICARRNELTKVTDELGIESKKLIERQQQEARRQVELWTEDKQVGFLHQESLLNGLRQARQEVLDQFKSEMSSKKAQFIQNKQELEAKQEPLTQQQRELEARREEMMFVF